MRLWRIWIAALLGLLLSLVAQADSGKIGVVVMHGKGGSPDKLVADLARGLQAKGMLVANLEMPWSGRRNYDVDVAHAEAEVDNAIAQLQQQGAARIFVAGHSQGGAFATYYAGRHPLAGLVAITPGGSSASQIAQEKLGDKVALARQMVDAGKANETAQFADFEGSRGVYAITTTAASYLSWFDPQGAMNLNQAVSQIKAATPVLWIVAQHDYPPLRKSNIPLYDKLPANPLNQLYQPDTDHKGAPTASLDKIADWIQQVAAH